MLNFDLMKRIAVAYNNAENPVIREEMKKKFLAMYDHIRLRMWRLMVVVGETSIIMAIVFAVCTWHIF